ncbi:hypothetical protein KY306_02600 [Candidatus Woesearchaeota archaeon]|nr:hypothetical protein [Candidatus Woesearchaeota archaeon]
MSLRKNVEIIKGKVHDAGAQDWDVKFFVGVVEEYAAYIKEKGRDAGKEYRDVLALYYETFKNQIIETLLGMEDGEKWAKFVHIILFPNVPWRLETSREGRTAKAKMKVAEVAFEKNIVTAVTSFLKTHVNELNEILADIKPFSALKLERKIKNMIVKDVQAALKTKRDKTTLEAVLGQKILIRNALTELLTKIVNSYRLERPTDEEVEFFVEPIYKKIILEIEAAIALLKKKKVA